MNHARSARSICFCVRWARKRRPEGRRRHEGQGGRKGGIRISNTMTSHAICQTHGPRGETSSEDPSGRYIYQTPAKNFFGLRWSYAWARSLGFGGCFRRAGVAIRFGMSMTTRRGEIESRQDTTRRKDESRRFGRKWILRHVSCIASYRIPSHIPCITLDVSILDKKHPDSRWETVPLQKVGRGHDLSHCRGGGVDEAGNTGDESAKLEENGEVGKTMEIDQNGGLCEVACAFFCRSFPS